MAVHPSLHIYPSLYPDYHIKKLGVACSFFLGRSIKKCN